ncbi:ferredoxin [Nodularia spumigena CENA596]|uniref:Ferredoxin n=1 Tax=Nodularia spumigena CENA596 TaxID=1819295 RepID=A0A166J277_NODSP|nr:four-helix bundle copper-binding protein [Nodularia spumigena]KZL49141.1 ferredoxin [Nodularia spumigena CENA596]
MSIEELTLNQINREIKECIQNCLDCHSICLNTVTFCLEQGGRHAEPNHIRLMLDCAEICTTTANFMLRNSDLHPLNDYVCAALCERCADDCDGLRPAGGDRIGSNGQMKACADMCRRCAESCRRLAMTAA